MDSSTERLPAGSRKGHLRFGPVAFIQIISRTTLLKCSGCEKTS
jgi:hypothetical protein